MGGGKWAGASWSNVARITSKIQGGFWRVNTWRCWEGDICLERAGEPLTPYLTPWVSNIWLKWGQSCGAEPSPCGVCANPGEVSASTDAGTPSTVHAESEKLHVETTPPWCQTHWAQQWVSSSGEAQRTAPLTALMGDVKTSACSQRRRDTDTEEKPCEDGGRDGRDVATSPGMPGAPGRGRKDPPLEPLEGAGPWDALISDFWSPGLGEDKYLLFKPPVWGILLQPPQDSYPLIIAPHSFPCPIFPCA